MRVIVAMLLVGTGCTSVHHSTLPPYVRDVRPMQGGLEVVSCEIIYTETEERAFGSKNTTNNLEHGRCWRLVIPTTVQPAPAPVVSP